MQLLPYNFSLPLTQNCQLITSFASSKPKALSSLQYNFTNRISRAPTGKFWAVDLSAFLQSSQCLSVLFRLLHRLLFLVPYFCLFYQM